MNHFRFEQIRTIGFMCNFCPNSLENFIKTTLNIWVQTLKNRVRVRSYRISVTMSKNHVTNSDIWILDIQVWIQFWSKGMIYNLNLVQVWNFYPNIRFVRTWILPAQNETWHAQCFYVYNIERNWTYFSTFLQFTSSIIALDLLTLYLGKSLNL